jgi:phosphoglycerol transferase
MLWRVLGRPVLLYAGAAVLCVAFLVFHLRLLGVSLRTPFVYNGDALISLVWVQNLLDDGWYDHNPRAGAPYGMDLRDFPASEAVHFALLKALGLGSRNVFRVANAFYLLTYPLATLTAVFAFRRLGLSALPSLVGGLLFAFLPFHLYRGVVHLFLSGYYVVPLALLTAVWLGQGALVGWRPWLLALVAAALSSSGGVYYAFFSCFFFLLAALGCCLRERRWQPLLPGLLLAGVVSLGVLANILPALLFAREQGVNRQVAHRMAGEADTYGLNLAQLVLPRSDHRLEAVRDWKARYTSAPGRPLPNDFRSSLGIVGSVGLALVIGWTLFGRRGREEDERIPILGGLAVGGILLATIGGLGSIFAFAVSPQIRAYDRTSVFLAFLALGGVVCLLDRLLARARSPLSRCGAVGLCAGTLLFGLWDQTAPIDVPDYAALHAAAADDAAFGAALEQALPPGSLVFQLPAVSFPEAPSVLGTAEYDHLRLLLHTRTLCFSHGAVRGRYGAARIAAVAALPPERLLPCITAMGYTGLHIDRAGYPDQARGLESRLRQLLNADPIVSANGRDLFFALTEYAARNRQGLSDREWERRRRDQCYPATVLFGEGFLGEEHTPEHTWQWAGPHAELILCNPQPEPRQATVRFFLQRPLTSAGTVTLSGIVEDRLEVGAGRVPLERTLLLPPGRHSLRLRCDAPPLVEPPPSSRVITFGVLDLEITFDGQDRPF